MKKLHILIAMTLLVSVNAMAQGWPANYGGVMLQGFFWDSYRTNWDGYATLDAGGTNYTWATMYGAGWQKDGDKITDRWALPNTTWRSLIDHKNEIAPFIDLLWLPQSGSTVCPEYVQYTGNSKTRPYREQDGYAPYGINYGDKIVNPDCMGFVPVFYFHHGLVLNPDGTAWTYVHNGETLTPKSYFGTEAELKQLIREYKAEGSFAIEDVVANHRGGLSSWLSGEHTKIDFPTEVWTSPDGVTHTISWDAYDVCSDDESGEGLGGPDSGGQGQWAPDIAHNRDETREKVKLYLRYLTEELGYVGYRLDYAQGMSGKNMADYMYELKPTFAVGENWNMDQGYLESWINSTFRNDHYQCAAFDFPLKRAINVAFNYGSHFQLLDGYTEGASGEYSNMKITPLINDPKYRRYAITFVENHDTFKDLPTDDTGYKDRLTTNILEANAFILCMPGTPCLFYAHFMHPDWHDTLVKLIKARRTAGITNESACVNGMERIGTDGAKWIVTGNNGEICLQLGAEAVAQPKPDGFSEVWSSSICRVSITESLAGQVESNVRTQLVNGYPIIDKGSGTYTAPIEVTITPSNDECTLVYTTNGHNPQAGDKTITEATTLTFSETTTLKVGVLVNGTVPASTVVTREYIAASAQSASKINIYVHDNNAPYVYLWGNSSSISPAEYSSFPGVQMSTKETVGGMEWWKVQVDRPAGEMNMILTWNPYDSNKSQTPDINGITSDVFYIVNNGVPTNVTNTFLPAIDNPMVSIDKATGTYEGSVTAKITASYSGATIVYTTDGTEPTVSSTQLTSGSTLTFTDDVTLRAGIVKDGEVINQVARSYNITTGSSVEPINGVEIYVWSSWPPYLHAWTGESNNINGNWGSEQQKLTDRSTTTPDGKSWYKWTTNETNFKMILHNNSGGQTKNIDITKAGKYYYVTNTNGSIEDIGNYNASSYKDVSSFYNSLEPIVIYVNSNVTPNLYTWKADGEFIAKYNGAWAGNTMGNPVHTTSDGKEWYKWTITGPDAINLIISNNGNNQTGNITNISGIHYFTYDNGNYEDVTGKYSNQSTLPSCITPMHDCYYFYFVDDGGFDSPFAWVWNNTTVYSGSSWPGEALVDVVGTDQNGNLIYRWTYYGDKPEPAKVIFSNNGNSQTADLDFVNGGYYNSAGTLLGTVSGNLMTLAEVIKDGKVGEQYTISNDLTAAFFNVATGKHLFAKDGHGDAIKKSYNVNSKPVPPAMRSFAEAEQSNWVELVLPSAINTTGGEKPFDGKTLLGQTVVGRLTDAINPTIELVANPIATNGKTYIPNRYVTGNFNATNAKNGDYFLVEPQAQEYATIEWAVYYDGKFYMPKNPDASNPNAVNTVHGAVNVSTIETYLNEQPQLANETMYTLKVIVKRKPQPQGAPRLMAGNSHIAVATDDPVSSQWEIAIVSAEKLSDATVTPIEKVTAERELVRTIYFNLNGIESDRPFQGVNIVVKEYSDGSRSASKVIK